MSEPVTQAVILAAGKGKRLHPVTPQRSKAMAPVAGKPMVARVLDTLIHNGVRHCILVVSPDDAEIVAYFQQRTDVRFDFVIQSQRLGMAHALGLATPHLQGSFILSACDNLVPPAHVAALLHTYQQTAANATLSLLAIDRAHAASTGIVEWDGTWVRRIVEKPTPAEAPSNISSLPLYLFSPKLLDYLPAVKPSPRGEYELQDAIQLLIAHHGRVAGVLTPGRLQLTNTADLLALNRHYLAIEPGTAQILTQAIGRGTRLIPPVRIEAGSEIGVDCVIGPYVTVERDCLIGAGVQLAESIILRQTQIAAGRRVVGEVVVGD